MIFETVSIPGGKEDTIIGYVIELMRQKPPEDEINDNKANQQ
jgi:hypothetical protein